MTADPAEAHGRPLGSEEKTRGIFGIQEKNRVNLNNKETFDYGKGSHEHSAQFLGTSMLRHTYWQRLLEVFDLKKKEGEKNDD